MKTKIKGITAEKKGRGLVAQEDANLLPLKHNLPLTVILDLPIKEPRARVLFLLQKRRRKLQSSQNLQ
uniref:Uncharacterized protein n=1 Tax=Gorilla gorilla gorilla TaxID=9595 RepID=A0A2I2YK10_GORGO